MRTLHMMLHRTYRNFSQDPGSYCSGIAIFICEDRVLTGPASGEKSSKSRNQTINGSRDVQERDREFFIDNLLVRIHLIIEMILVDRPRAMGV